MVRFPQVVESALKSFRRKKGMKKKAKRRFSSEGRQVANAKSRSTLGAN